MSDPYREAEAQAFCAICEAETTLVCQRCGRPGCAAHLFGVPALCSDCDLAYNGRDLRGHREGWLEGVAGFGGYVASIATAIVIGGPAGVAVGAASFFAIVGSAIGVGFHRRKTERRRFAGDKRKALKSPDQ